MTYAEILNMPPSARLELLEVIWDSLTKVPEAIPISDDIREELDRRLANYHRDTETAQPWEDIRDEVFRNR